MRVHCGMVSLKSPGVLSDSWWWGACGGEGKPREGGQTPMTHALTISVETPRTGGQGL